MYFLRSIPLIGLLACIKASPISLNPRAVTISSTDFSNFQLFSQYAIASYCSSNSKATDVGTSAPITCTNDVCPLVEAAGASSVIEFADDGSLLSIVGFVAIDATRSLIVVSFRGTSNDRDRLADLDALLVSTPICGSCKVHEGFNAEWNDRRNTVVTAVNTAKAQHPSFKLVLTGHSLGAAVATIGGAYFRGVLKYPCDIYTYGSPRVGNDRFVNFVSGTGMGHTYRVTHVDDPIPQLPPGGWLTGYYHTTPEYWLSTGTSSTDNYTIQDVKVCEGINNNGCNGGTNLFAFDFVAHDNYFENVAKCE